MPDFLGGIVSTLGNNVDEIIGGGVLILVTLLVNLLPLSPFVGLSIEGLPGQAIGWLNYFVDIGRMMDLLGAWLGCVSIWMLVTKVLEVLRGSGGVKSMIGQFVRKIASGGLGQ